MDNEDKPKSAWREKVSRILIIPAKHKRARQLTHFWKRVTQNKFIFTYVIAAILIVGLQLGQSILTRPQTLRGKAASTGVSLSVQPQTLSVVPEQKFSVSVNMDTKGFAVTGTDLVLLYDPAYLTLLSLEPGPNNVFTVTANTSSPDVLVPASLAIPGRATISIGTGPSAGGKSGRGTVSVANFSANKAGQTNVSISPETFVGSIGSAGNNTLGTTNLSSITISLPTPNPTITPVVTQIPTSSPGITKTPTPTPIPTASPKHTTKPIPSRLPLPTQVSNDTNGPTVQIQLPKDNSQLSSRYGVRIVAFARDPSGIANIQIFFDSNLIQTCNWTFCSAYYSVSQLSSGSHTIQVTAVDKSPARNATTTSISVNK